VAELPVEPVVELPLPLPPPLVPVGLHAAKENVIMLITRWF
jgi:hypothetical protein